MIRVEKVRWVLKRRWWNEVVVSSCVLFHGSLYPLFPFYECFFSLVSLVVWVVVDVLMRGVCVYVYIGYTLGS